MSDELGVHPLPGGAEETTDKVKIEGGGLKTNRLVAVQECDATVAQPEILLLATKNEKR
jgi:hypothetical protein